LQKIDKCETRSSQAYLSKKKISPLLTRLVFIILNVIR
jgi:hypothetical protein